MSPLPSRPDRHFQRPALPNPALRNGARAVEKSEKLFEPNRRPKAKNRKPGNSQNQKRRTAPQGEFFSPGRGHGENKFLNLASLFLSPPRRRRARILEYVSHSPTRAAAKRGRQNGKLFSTCPQGAILAGVGTAGAFSLVTFFWRQKKVTTLQQGSYLTSERREKSRGKPEWLKSG
jgi:hypothetical protein